jgi:putative addiction module CopG family antidote
MDVHLTEQQEILIRKAIESGRFQSPDDAVTEALSLWEQREARIAEGVKRGLADAERGNFVDARKVWAGVEKILQS